MAWQEEVSPDQWKAWGDLAERYASGKRQNTSLGFEEFSSLAIEKLLSQTKRPANVEAWIRLVISNQYRDWWERNQRRKGPNIRVENESDWERDILEFVMESPSARLIQRESVSEVLSVLNDDEKAILIQHISGFTSQQIAEDMGLGSGKIAVTRLGQIRKKVRDKFDQTGFPRQ